MKYRAINYLWKWGPTFKLQNLFHACPNAESHNYRLGAKNEFTDYDLPTGR